MLRRKRFILIIHVLFVPSAEVHVRYPDYCGTVSVASVMELAGYVSNAES